LLHKGFHFGEIVAPPDKLPRTVNPTTTLHIEAENYDWSHFKDVPSIRWVADNLILTYYRGSLTLTRPTNIADDECMALGSPMNVLGPSRPLVG
jgi:hypothetical protein